MSKYLHICYLLREGRWSEEAKGLLRQLVTRGTAGAVQFAFPQLLHALPQVGDHRVVVVTKIKLQSHLQKTHYFNTLINIYLILAPVGTAKYHPCRV